MTRREEELLDLIKKDPMATQQELADALGITRSSVAVHLSSLMKKGKIKGRAYIIEEEEKLCVIGGMNVDLQGFPLAEMKLHDSNPGRILRSPGGVGRNLAETLAKLGVSVRLISALGRDEDGQYLLEHTRAWGVDTCDVLLSASGHTSVYLSLMDKDGDMLAALNQMEILEEVDIPFLESKSEILKRAPALVLDANLSEEALLYLCQEYGDKKIFAEAVSATKVLKLRDCLPSLYSIKPNLLELESLVGKKLSSMKDYKEALKQQLGTGLQSIFLTLGAKGVLCATKDALFLVKGKPRVLRSATGAGDAFFAAAIAGLMKGMSFEEASVFAQSAALLTLEEEGTLGRMNVEEIKKRRKDVEVEHLSW